MYPHLLVLDECGEKWQEFIGRIEGHPDHLFEFLFLSEETREMLKVLQFKRGRVGQYSEISHNDSQFFQNTEAQSGTMLCSVLGTKLHIDMTVEHEKLLFFDIYGEEQDEEEDWYHPKPVFPSLDITIIGRFMHEFQLLRFIKSANDAQLGIR